METRFRALNFLCKLQVYIGVLVIIGGVIYLLSSLFVNGPGLLLGLAVGAGVIFFGLQIIAMAQVFQCLMQIETNTRHANSAASLSPEVAPTKFTITGQPR